MPRKGHTQKRDVLADPLYSNKVVTKLINNIMLDGKRGVAQKIVYGAFEEVAEKTGKDAVVRDPDLRQQHVCKELYLSRNCGRARCERIREDRAEE